MSVLAATRPTRRDALQRPWQSLAAILLVALPVAFFSAVFIEGSSTGAASNLSTARTTVSYAGGACEQSVDGSGAHCTGDGTTPGDRPQQEILNESLPAGFTGELQVQATVLFTTGDAHFPSNIIQVAEDRENLPQPGEILVPRGQLEMLAADIGDTLTVQTPTGGVEVLVTGITPGYTAVVTEPTFLDPASDRVGDSGVAEWGVAGPREFTWEDVEQLNAAGFVVRSQDVIDNPPPPGEAMSEGDFAIYHQEPVDRAIAVILDLIGVMIIAFLVLTLISPVFTISVGRQSRNFALMASQGAAPHHIRWAVLVYGFFAGLAGASLGLLIGGFGVSAWWSSRYPEWPVVVPWAMIAALWIFAVIAATVAAFLPAVIASRASIIAGIHGASPDRLLRWRRWMSIGPVLLLVSLLLFIIAQLMPASPVIGSVSGYRELLQGFGTLVGVPGIALTAPAMVWLLGRLRRPLALRLAGRDLLRQSLRSIPAIGAIAALITVSSTMLISQDASSQAQAHRTSEVYQPGTVFIQGAEGLERAVAAVNKVVPPTTHSDIYGIDSEMDTWRYAWLVDDPASPVHPECDWENPDPETCGYQMNTIAVSGPTMQLGASVLVATPELLDVLVLTAEVPAGPAMLVAENTANTKATFQINSQEGNDEEEILGRPATLDLAPVIPAGLTDWLPTPAAFADFGVEPEHLGAVMIADRNLTQRELREINDQLENSGTTVTSPVAEQDVWDSDQLVRFILTGVVIVIVALVLMLAMGHTRRQNSLLAAVGAAPGLNRSTNALFGGLIALSGTTLGLVAGHLGALLTAYREKITESGWVLDPGTMAHVGIDWWLVLGLMVIAPLVAGALGWVLAPKTQLSEYRAD